MCTHEPYGLFMSVLYEPNGNRGLNTLVALTLTTRRSRKCMPIVHPRMEDAHNFDSVV
jgi:hypothetical protein